MGFTEIVKPLNTMSKQHAKIEWTLEAKQAFKDINKEIVNAPVLVSPNYLKSFYIYSFTSNHSCANILIQMGDEGNEHPVSFMSAPLKDVELRYHNIQN